LNTPELLLSQTSAHQVGNTLRSSSAQLPHGHRRGADRVPADLSTGHLILAGSLLDFTGDKVKVFEIAIQTGAMLAVVWFYRRGWAPPSPAWAAIRPGAALRAERADRLPAGGRPRPGCFGKAIKAHLFTPVPVAWPSSSAAFVILWVERSATSAVRQRTLRRRRARVETVDDMGPLDALKVGLLQCLALVPGTSRSGATIIGAHAARASRARPPPSSASSSASRR
jgi:undecaprenyl-diphosphatase